MVLNDENDIGFAKSDKKFIHGFIDFIAGSLG